MCSALPLPGGSYGSACLGRRERPSGPFGPGAAAAGATPLRPQRPLLCVRLRESAPREKQIFSSTSQVEQPVSSSATCGGSCLVGPRGPRLGRVRGTGGRARGPARAPQRTPPTPCEGRRAGWGPAETRGDGLVFAVRKQQDRAPQRPLSCPVPGGFQRVKQTSRLSFLNSSTPATRATPPSGLRPRGGTSPPGEAGGRVWPAEGSRAVSPRGAGPCRLRAGGTTLTQVPRLSFKARVADPSAAGFRGVRRPSY